MGHTTGKRHLRRIAAPKTWPIPRKGTYWIAKPIPGPHKMELSMPLALWIRDYLKLGKTMREVKYILNEGKVLVFSTDCEHYEDRPNTNLIELCKDVDLLVYDSQYTEDEYYGRNGQFSRKGWGHSTMREGVKVAISANVEKLVLFHHDPSHNDETIKQIETESRQLFPQSIAAYEGLQIDLSQEALPKSLFD